MASFSTEWANVSNILLQIDCFETHFGSTASYERNIPERDVK